MKKSLVSALTTALVVGAASTTFAAANPFADVPADHWAYDAVAQLAADGVVDGYGDGSYRGQQQITRYEMAQMIARAMAKGGADQAVIDKLAAEFAEELNSLGVRVAALEKKIDNVTLTGRLRYRYHHKKGDNAKAPYHNDKNELMWRFDINAKVNNNWKVVSRIDIGTKGTHNRNLVNSEDLAGTDFVMDRLWAQGDYKNFNVKLGKFHYISIADYGANNERRVSGIQLIVGKKIQAALTAGRFEGGITNPSNVIRASNYQGIEVYNNRKSKLTWGVAYHHLGKSRYADWYVNSGGKEKEASIGVIGLGYQFSKDIKAVASYAQNFDDSGLSKKNTKRYNIEIDYKGANKAKPGSYGLWVAYRHIGNVSGMNSTYGANDTSWSDDFKGLHIGTEIALAKNITGIVKYHDGKTVSGSKYNGTKSDKDRGIFTEVNFFF